LVTGAQGYEQLYPRLLRSSALAGVNPQPLNYKLMPYFDLKLRTYQLRMSVLVDEHLKLLTGPV